MAEMQTAESGGKKKGGKVRTKKMSTRVDLTPMVDLGFLLITFFMLTTTLAKPQIMALVLPDKEEKEDKQEPVKESKVLTLLLGGKDKVYWYEGITDPKLDSCDYSAEGVRKVILDKMDKVKAQWGLQDYEDIRTKEAKKGSFLTVLIKATDEARYKNFVDIMDEMSICHVRYYVPIEISEQEKTFIKNPAAGMPKFDAAAQAEAANK
jgi:biopolymer transport protein ExbD